MNNSSKQPAAADIERVLRANCLQIFQAGVEAADPGRALKRCLTHSGGQLNIAQEPLAPRSGSWSAIHVIAFGKAACAMAEAARKIIPEALLSNNGVIVTNAENAVSVPGIKVLTASHPLPDAAGFSAARQIADIARQARAGELLLVLVSGGGSALIPFPVEGVSLEQKIKTTDLLLASGATINEINCVRKHLSQLKGGGLARFAAPADLHALILSDVLGDDLSVIASGPTVPDPCTYQDALAILENRGIRHNLPLAVIAHLQAGAQGRTTETPKPGDPIFLNSGHTLIGSNAISVNAIHLKAQNLGYDSRQYSTHLCGEARSVAEDLVAYAKQLQSTKLAQPIALLAGGETTVTVTGKGKGGRNQEMALAFACAAEQQHLGGHWTFLSGGTDGRDGPTDAAGGMVDPDSLGRMRKSGIDPYALLHDNNAYNALIASNDLLITGATGTNVADLQILLIKPETNTPI